ncbi:MAG: metallophosphoesterase family protein [Lachnospiraceae bacterium]|nr:metallophosphoesterase family protein [Lachnospiraceae bacterium]
MKIKSLIRAGALILILALFLLPAGHTANTYGEAPPRTELSTAGTALKRIDYNNWLARWNTEGADNSGRILMTPGSTPADLQFSWYSEKAGTPAVAISKNPDLSQSSVFWGQAKSIKRSNGTVSYEAANQVSITGFFQENTTYYYRYTSDYSARSVSWSDVFTYTTGGTSTFCALLIGDAQIGASGNIAADTYNFCRTLKQAKKTSPDAAFLLSTGDQIDYKKNSGDNGLRERQYAGFLYSDLLRSLPVAAAIGNHETKGKDYQYHFYNPNTAGNYGATPSGCDYYFRYGDALFIVLNSNSRKVSAHRKLMKKATSWASDAKWRIVMFHHDIYGSGAMHSNRTSANMRMLLAPLMDEFSIDIVFSGHDHSYARSYSILDGTAITDSTEEDARKESGGMEGRGTLVTNPAGTTYISLGTSSGSKMYDLASPKQFYVAERSNEPAPTFSTLTVSEDILTVKTYDYEGNKYAGDFCIQKTAARINPAATAKKLQSLKKNVYTKASYRRLSRALKSFRSLFHPTAPDKGAVKASKRFRKKNDPLSYYGYAAGTSSALPKGFSTLLDKTRIRRTKISADRLRAADKALKKAFSRLKRTSRS